MTPDREKLALEALQKCVDAIEEFKDAGKLAEGFHAGLRKGTDAADADSLWKAIAASRTSAWGDAAAFAIDPYFSMWGGNKALAEAREAIALLSGVDPFRGLNISREPLPFWESREPLAETAPSGEGETLKSCGQWAVETFGKASIARALQRAEEELEEAKQAPCSKVLEEIADVVICLAAAAHAFGGDLQSAIDAKMAVNRKRRWEVRGDGTGYHIPSEASHDQ